MWIKISMSSLKSLLSGLLQHYGKQFIFRLASSVVSIFATASRFIINVMEFYQITPLSIQLKSIYANWISFHVKPQLNILCILIRINEEINEKIVSMSAKLTIKVNNSTFGELSYHNCIFSTMQCCDLDTLTTSLEKNSSPIFKFFLSLWPRRTLGEVCLRQPECHLQNLSLFDHTDRLRVHVQSSTTQPTCLYTRPTHSAQLCLYSRPRSIKATLHTTSSFFPINIAYMSWGHTKSKGVIVITTHSVMPSRMGPRVVHNLQTSLTSIHPYSIESLTFSCPFHVIYGYYTQLRVGSPTFDA